MTTFVKSASTVTTVANSRREVDKLLRRYGASAISIGEDIEHRLITVSFVIPNGARDATKVPVKLPISVANVYHALYGKPSRPFPSGYDTRRMAQAERVAWRNIVLWIDAALSAASVGLQTITEAFFAHAVVGENGTRMIEVVESCQSQLGAGVQRLLTAST